MISPLAGAAVGAVAGLIVSSWQGFKDPPWERFSARKFSRSIVVTAAAGAARSWLSSNRRLAVDNLGALAFAVVAIERTIGEAYKGFFKRAPHAEYNGLLRKLRIPTRSYGLKRQVRGIFAGQSPRYPEWLARRGVFAASYAAAVGVSLALLFW